MTETERLTAYRIHRLLGPLLWPDDRDDSAEKRAAWWREIARLAQSAAVGVEEAVLSRPDGAQGRSGASDEGMGHPAGMPANAAETPADAPRGGRPQS